MSQNQNRKGESVKSWPPKPALKHISVLGAYMSLRAFKLKKTTIFCLNHALLLWAH